MTGVQTCALPIWNQSGEHADGGRLAGAVGPEEAKERSARDLEIDAVDGGIEAIRFSKIADQNWRGTSF